MNDISSEFSFLRDPDLDLDLKKALLASIVEERRALREEGHKVAADKLEQRRFWHNTPVVLALVGTITIAANGLVSYLTAMRSTSDTVTISELNEKLDRQRTQLKTELAEQEASAEAQRKADAEERGFEFKIVEEQLNQPKSEAERASVLLFLVRAGIFKKLDGPELRAMAEKSLDTLKREGKIVGLPGIPSLGVAPAEVGLGKIHTEDDILDQILGWEGGFTQSPGQPETAFNAGISLANLSRYLGRDASADELRSLDRDTIRGYYKRYFEPFSGIPNLQLRAAVIDIAVMSGTGRAIGSVQRGLGKATGKEIVASDVLDTATTALINNFPDPNLLVEYVNCEQIAALQAQQNYALFGKGWMVRIRAFSPVQLHGVCAGLS